MRILNITQVSSGVDDIALFASLSLRLALKPRSSGRRPIGSDGRALKQNSLDLTSHALNLHILKAIITQAGRKNGGLRGGRRFVGGGTSYFCSTRRVCMVWFISHNVLAPVLCFVALSGAQPPGQVDEGRSEAIAPRTSVLTQAGTVREDAVILVVAVAWCFRAGRWERTRCRMSQFPTIACRNMPSHASVCHFMTLYDINHFLPRRYNVRQVVTLGANM